MSKKKTFEEFVIESKIIHGNEYDYFPPYINAHTNVKMIHKICGEEISQLPLSHLRGMGCRVCANNKRKTFEEFIISARKIHGDDYNYLSPYINNYTGIKIIHRICGHEFIQKPKNHIDGKNGCPKCFKTNELKPNEKFLDEARYVHGDNYEYLSEYIRRDIDIKILHKECGKIFYQTPASHVFKACGCSHCFGDELKTFEQFVIDAKEVHGNEYFYPTQDYKGCKVLLNIIHTKCGAIFKQIPVCHLRGQGCPDCFGNKLKTHDDFINEANLLHNNEYDYIGKYINAVTKIEVVHKKCGTYFTISPNKHLSLMRGCPKCGKRISKPETAWLDLLGISKENRQYPAFKYNTKRQCDGFDPTTNTILEYNGSFYHGDIRFFLEEEYNEKVKAYHGDLYKVTLSRREELLLVGYNVYEKWDRDGREIFFYGKGNIMRPKLSPDAIVVNYDGSLGF